MSVRGLCCILLDGKAEGVSQMSKSVMLVSSLGNRSLANWPCGEREMEVTSFKCFID